MLAAPSTPDDANADLNRLAALTARYARYSRSAGGISSVIGGGLLIVSFVVGALVALTPTLRHALASMPIVWIASKELLRRFYYQRHGAAVELPSHRLRRWRLGMMTCLSLFSGFVLYFFASRGAFSMLFHGRAGRFAWPLAGYLLFISAMPLVAWRWFWSIPDFLLGVLLLCQAAVVTAGLHYSIPWIFIASMFGFTGILTGVYEHRDYLSLRRELGSHA